MELQCGCNLQGVEMKRRSPGNELEGFGKLCGVASLWALLCNLQTARKRCIIYKASKFLCAWMANWILIVIASVASRIYEQSQWNGWFDRTTTWNRREKDLSALSTTWHVNLSMLLFSLKRCEKPKCRLKSPKDSIKSSGQKLAKKKTHLSCYQYLIVGKRLQTTPTQIWKIRTEDKRPEPLIPSDRDWLI